MKNEEYHIHIKGKHTYIKICSTVNAKQPQFTDEES
jgi:hypothetical protein